MTPEEQIQYERALKRVKKIKGFYTHLLIYFVINLMIVIINIQNLKTGEIILNWKISSLLSFGELVW